MHFSTQALIDLMQNWGLLLLFPLAVVEGPIVTIIAGWFVKLGLWPFAWVYAVCILADLAGDLILYGLGRGGAKILPPRWRARLGVDDSRLAQLASHFDTRGARTLLLTKASHSLGFAVLPAAGAARMPVAAFLWWNLLGTLPKSLLFLILGYTLGQAHESINGWIGRVSIVIIVIAMVAVGLLWRRFRTQ